MRLVISLRKDRAVNVCTSRGCLLRNQSDSRSDMLFMILCGQSCVTRIPLSRLCSSNFGVTLLRFEERLDADSRSVT